MQQTTNLDTSPHYNDLTWTREAFKNDVFCRMYRSTMVANGNCCSTIRTEGTYTVFYWKEPEKNNLK